MPKYLCDECDGNGAPKARPSKGPNHCEACNGSGLHPKAKELAQLDAKAKEGA